MEKGLSCMKSKPKHTENDFKEKRRKMEFNILVRTFKKKDL